MTTQDISALIEAAMPVAVLAFAALHVRNSASTASDTIRMLSDMAAASAASHGRIVQQLLAASPKLAADGAKIVADIAPAPVAVVTTSAPSAPQPVAVAEPQ